jgi:hypothetical protein
MVRLSAAGSREIDELTKEISIRQACICCSEPLRFKEVFDLVIASPERDIPIKDDETPTSTIATHL